ncbi:MAG: hypothetical protein MR015_05290, partial [Clostridiales bacterium]|nr:hypothetical protein [Clostridiales bacterium]
MVGKDGMSQKTYSYTDYGETTEQGENDFYNEVCYGGGIYDKTTGLYYLNARYYSPENGSFLTQDTYRGSRSKTETLNLYGYCAGNPISYTDPSGHWAALVIAGSIGAAMGGYDGYKYAQKKGYKGWKKDAVIIGGAVLGVVNPFKIFKGVKIGYQAYKTAKYSKKLRAAHKATKGTKKVKAKPKHTVVMKKNTKAKLQSKPVQRNSKGVKKLQKSAGGTIGCFTAGTKIHTKDGFKAIETIKAGDYVWSENPETHEKALKKVKKIFVREKDSVVRLSINGDAIETTNEHPFYVEGHGWTNAYDLKVGDKVRLEDGTTGIVEKAKHVALDTSVTVYNFEVEDFHTYYVSEQKVLVHNTCAATEKNTQVAKASNATKASKAEITTAKSTKKAYATSRPSYRKGLVEKVWEA